MSYSWPATDDAQNTAPLQDRASSVQRGETEQARYYFDVLPARPPILPLETLSSYSIRLAQANGIRLVQHLVSLYFPLQSPNQTRHLNDCPPLRLANLEALSGCPTPLLLATTFYPLGPLFGRHVHPQTLAKFLSGAVAPSLRYCPGCLSEDAHPYYRLTWRFTLLGGCPKHRCELLGACWRCAQPLPLIATPIRMAECLACGADLRAAKPTPLQDGEVIAVEKRAADIEFALTARRGDAPANANAWLALASNSPAHAQERLAYGHAIGQRLTALRAPMEMTREELSAITGLRHNTIRSLEGGLIQQHGASLVQWVTYAEALGSSLRDILDDVRWHHPKAIAPRPGKRRQRSAETAPKRKPDKPRVPPMYSNREAELAARVEAAFDQFRVQGVPATPEGICEAVGELWPALRRYPSVRALLSQIEPRFAEGHRITRDDKAIYERVERAISDLRKQGIPLTRRAVAWEVGLARSAFCNYARVEALLDAEVPTTPEALLARKARREQELLQIVEDAARRLVSEGKPVNCKAIFRAVGRGRNTFAYYPSIKAFLAQIERTPPGMSGEQRAARERDLLAAVSDAVAYLKVEGRPITQYALVRHIGVSVVSLRRYPKVMEALAEILKDNGRRGKRKPL